MKQRYLEGEALLAACQAGSGAIVMVEGETAQDDAYFYQQWFGDQAREISFLPQNGWHRVEAAVRELRAALPHRAVYGIVDRDFKPQHVIDDQHVQRPADGIYRLPFYTLENALLEPVGWFAVSQTLSRGPRSGWEDLDAVEKQIDAAYARCLPIAAFNRVVYDERERSSDGRFPKYLEHPSGAPTARERLDAWGRRRGVPSRLPVLYERHLATLASLPREALSAHVTGKAVLATLCEAFNATSSPKVPSVYLVNNYLREHPEPPAALTRVVEAILTAAQAR